MQPFASIALEAHVKIGLPPYSVRELRVFQQPPPVFRMQQKCTYWARYFVLEHPQVCAISRQVK
jgi:hypothetical protein